MPSLSMMRIRSISRWPLSVAMAESMAALSFRSMASRMERATTSASWAPFRTRRWVLACSWTRRLYQVASPKKPTRLATTSIPTFPATLSRILMSVPLGRQALGASSMYGSEGLGLSMGPSEKTGR